MRSLIEEIRYISNDKKALKNNTKVLILKLND